VESWGNSIFEDRAEAGFVEDFGGEFIEEGGEESEGEEAVGGGVDRGREGEGI